MQASTIDAADQLIAEVTRSSGLDDFGDPDFRAGLDMFLDSVMRNAGLDETATQRLMDQVRHRLTNRLQVEEWYRTHPELDGAPLGAPPLSITGLPRTGTTALVNMLSVDDQFRKLRSWEQAQPCPPPIPGTEATDPRRQAAQIGLARMIEAQPEFAAMHLSDIDATEEDVELLGLSFHAQQLSLPIFDYHRWWRDVDMRATFAYHRRVVTLLQSHEPSARWLFKAPAHNFHLAAIFDAYPDMRVIVTHRDPVKAIPSAISLLCALQPPGQRFTPEEFGRIHSEHLRIGAERMIAARAQIGEDKFLDVHHRDFVADPFSTIERVYDFTGRTLSAETRTLMEEWQVLNRSGVHGRHHYTPEQFGLSAAQIRSDFDFYIRRFDVESEG